MYVKYLYLYKESMRMYAHVLDFFITGGGQCSASK